jgi:hypothetical protein
MKANAPYLLLLLLLLLTGCGNRQLTDYVPTEEAPVLFPDYADITLPANIAPMNFFVDSVRTLTAVVETKESREQFDSRNGTLSFPLKRWKRLLTEARGDTLHVSLYAEHLDGTKLRYPAFYWYVSPDSIDRYLSYRLIEPAYEVWNQIDIVERNIENFDTRSLAKSTYTNNSCMNCHTSNRAPHSPATFMHVRGAGGGTIYSQDGVSRKINTRTDSTAAAVYGELSADGRYGIFTTAEILPILHSYRTERMEVFDEYSDLILIDFREGTVTTKPCINGTKYQETFPCFSADNRTIYFCRSLYRPQPAKTHEMHYDLCAISFDPATGALGDSIRTIYDATAAGTSVSFPKCSPDGRFLLMTVSDYGTFPIWHTETDLRMLDLQTGEVNRMEQTNGRYSDSYHSWSSNGSWITFASKRGDRVYGRPYFAHVSPTGECSKAFVLPQADPHTYLNTLKSFNIPELYPTAETYDARRIRELYLDTDAEALRYESKKDLALSGNNIVTNLQKKN